MLGDPPLGEWHKLLYQIESQKGLAAYDPAGVRMKDASGIRAKAAALKIETAGMSSSQGWYLKMPSFEAQYAANVR